MRSLPFIIFLLLQAPGIAAPRTRTVASPDGMLRFSIASTEADLEISAVIGQKTILEWSALEMILDGTRITKGVYPGKIRKFSETGSYPVSGLHSSAKNNFNGLSWDFNHKSSGTEYTIEVKVFNDAFAFRYLIRGNETDTRAPDESTVFRFPSGTVAWYHDLYMHYEGIHVKKLIDTIPSGQWAAPPLTVKLPSGNYASVTEANLVNYPGMALQSDGNKGFMIRLGHSHPASYPYVLRYAKEDIERLSKIAELKGTIITPWRVILAGKDLNTLVNSDAITNLCSPPEATLFPYGSKTDWIRSGRAVWRYLDGGGDNTLRNMKEFSRIAAELGFEYNILENFWSKWPEDSIRALVDYSEKLGVGIIVWKHSKDLREADARQRFFNRLKDLGIAGIKIDFFDHEAKEVIDLYDAIFRETSALKLVLILHGSNKPTGLSRTYPNVLIYEGVRGMESSRLTDRATHETTLPFTRMLAGPADYSVCHFGERRRNTTWVHQVATTAIFSAPVITYAANPFNIRSNPSVEMIKSIPAVWDETRVLSPSEIGEIAVYAQRKGSTWFLSAINGLQPRKVEVGLDFLGEGSYTSFIIRDDDSNTASLIQEAGNANRDIRLILEFGPGGGYMARFIKE